MRFRILVDGEVHEIEVEGTPPSLTVRVDDATYRARVRSGAGEFDVHVGSDHHRIAIRGNRVTVDGQPVEVVVESREEVAPAASGGGRSGPGTLIEVRPPMPGRVVKLRVAAGDHVRRGQTVAVLEAMKMQNEIPAPEEAVVRSVDVREGDSIGGDRVIAVLETR